VSNSLIKSWDSFAGGAVSERPITSGVEGSEVTSRRSEIWIGFEREGLEGSLLRLSF
jgi:hypothetical protein